MKIKEKKCNGKILLSILLVLILSIGIFILIGKLQQFIFATKDYEMFKFKEPYNYLVFVFEIEMLAIVLGILGEKYNRIELECFRYFKKVAKKYFKLTIIFNVIIMYLAITGVTVVTKDKIIDHSFYNPIGKMYSYENIQKVDTGINKKGDFYYYIYLSDSKRINLYQCTSKYEDTYLELEILDEELMKLGIEKTSSNKNIEKCDLDERYINRFKKIINS